MQVLYILLKTKRIDLSPSIRTKMIFEILKLCETTLILAKEKQVLAFSVMAVVYQ